MFFQTTTTTQADIENNTIRGKIFLEPTRTAEYISLDFTVTNSDQFDSLQAKRLEEIYYPGDKIPLYLDKKSETLKIIQYLRNEAHRFGITFHRNKRSKGAIKSELEQIPNIGTKTITTLLRKFKSVKRVKTSSLKELEDVIGLSRAQHIYNFYHQNKE